MKDFLLFFHFFYLFTFLYIMSLNKQMQCLYDETRFNLYKTKEGLINSPEERHTVY